MSNAKTFPLVPPVRRIKPHCEVSNALKKWHIAYHGTSVGALRRTLDHSQLLPGRNPHFLVFDTHAGVDLSERGLHSPRPLVVAGTSSIFSVSPAKAEGPNGYSEPEENSAPGREVPRVRLSPTMRYSGMEIFAPKVQ